MVNFKGESLEPYWRITEDSARYNINIATNLKLHICLGEIKGRKDGRYDCWRRRDKNKFFQWCDDAQTVKTTLEDGQRWVEDGINHIPTGV